MAPIALNAPNQYSGSSESSTRSHDALCSAIRSSPHTFLQPPFDLHANSLSVAKQYLDPLASSISQLQLQRQISLRRKRKRGEKLEAQIEKPLALKQLYTKGFETEQVWAQAKRILDSATAELQQSLLSLPRSNKRSGKAECKTNGLRREQRTVRFQESASDKFIESGPGSRFSQESEEDEDGRSVDQSSGEGEVNDIMEADDVISDIEADSVDMMVEDDDGNIEEPDDKDLLVDSDLEEEAPEVFVPDKLGLNDGFFSIDDFNRQSGFLEQQDARGQEENAASDEEDVDWDIDPLAAGSNGGVGQAPEGDDEKSSEEDDGPTFGNANLTAPSNSDMDEDTELEGELGEMPSIQNTNDIMYADFFVPPPRKLTKTARRRALPKTQPPPSISNQADPSEADVQRALADVRRDIFEDDLEPDELSNLSDSAGQPRSSHQKRQAQLTAEIRRLESEAVAKKPWTLSGEARAGDRPLNSLLEEDLEFERAGKPVPVITQEVREDIEALIKRRIINREFDEVIRRRPDSLTTASGKDVRRGRLELEDGKPTQSLAEIYEAEHLQNVDPEGYVDKRSEALKKEHEKIEALWKDISAKLDALTSLHFRPKPVEVTVNAVSDVPTIMMEDARPNAGADVGESMLAPQEVYRAGEDRNKQVEVATRSGLPVAREEMTREEKLRRRRREKERIKKAGGVDLSKAKNGIVKGRKAEKKSKVVGDLKKGGVRVIGRKGEIRDTEGREVKGNRNAGKGVGAYKL